MGTKDGTHSLDFGGGAKLWVDENGVIQSTVDGKNLYVPSRYDLKVQNEGLIAETFPRLASPGANTAVSGTVYYVSIGLFAGDVITNMHLNVLVVGTGNTLAKVGLYDSTLLQLGRSNDQSADWNTNATLKTIPLITPVVIPKTGLYYCAAISVFSTTGTSISRGSVAQPFGVALNGKQIAFGSQTGQSDLPSQGVIGTGAVQAYWFGVS